jgi:hypothetical protein
MLGYIGLSLIGLRNMLILWNVLSLYCILCSVSLYGKLMICCKYIANNTLVSYAMVVVVAKFDAGVHF